MPKKPCAHPGCVRLIDLCDARCDKHTVDDNKERGKRERSRRSERPSRRWYSLAAWRGKGGRRARQLAKEPICRMCPGWPKQPATVADHVVPHRDDYGMFWFGELQSLCKVCHDIKKQRAERRSDGGGA